MNWKQKKAAQERFDKEQAFQQRVGDLAGLGEPEDHGPDTVGWFQAAAGTVKGTGHLCLACCPDRPLGFLVVTRNLLAARMPCTRCGVPLEKSKKNA